MDGFEFTSWKYMIEIKQPVGKGPVFLKFCEHKCWILSTFASFICLFLWFCHPQEDGSVVCWGAATYGGDSPVLSQRIRTIRSTEPTLMGNEKADRFNQTVSIYVKHIFS